MTLRKSVSLAIVAFTLALGTGGGRLVTPLEARTHMLNPTLEINTSYFCTGSLSNDWAIEVHAATPGAGVFLQEYIYTSGWSPGWGGNIGTTDGGGSFGYVARPPDVQGDYYAVVTVDGQDTNPVIYHSRYSYCSN